MMRPAVLVLALFLALPAMAQIYSWKDRDGRVHYTDTPPPTGEFTVIQRPRGLQPSPPPAEDSGDAAAAAEGEPDPNRPRTLSEREREFRERRAAQAEAQAKTQEDAAREAERQRFCEQARNQLAALESGQRISRFNAQGEREFLDDDARSAEAARLQGQIAQHCQ